MPIDEPAPATASVQAGAKSFQPRNLSGHFEKIAIQEQAPVAIAVEFPADAGDEVLVEAAQGGLVNDRREARTYALGKDRKLDLSFVADSGPGLYQVVLRRGYHEEVLQFWVPTERPEFDPPALN